MGASRSLPEREAFRSINLRAGPLGIKEAFSWTKGTKAAFGGGSLLASWTLLSPGHSGTEAPEVESLLPRERGGWRGGGEGGSEDPTPLWGRVLPIQHPVQGLSCEE